MVNVRPLRSTIRDPLVDSGPRSTLAAWAVALPAQAPAMAQASTALLNTARPSLYPILRYLPGPNVGMAARQAAGCAKGLLTGAVGGNKTGMGRITLTLLAW